MFQSIYIHIFFFHFLYTLFLFINHIYTIMHQMIVTVEYFVINTYQIISASLYYYFLFKSSLNLHLPFMHSNDYKFFTVIPCVKNRTHTI